MEAVADFERCVALLRGGDPGGATTALLSLRDNPQCVDIARAVRGRLMETPGASTPSPLFRDGALKSWDARPSNERDAMATPSGLPSVARGEVAAQRPALHVTAAAARRFATLWARGYVDDGVLRTRTTRPYRGALGDAVVAVWPRAARRSWRLYLVCWRSCRASEGRTWGARARGGRRRGTGLERRGRVRCVGGVRNATRRWRHGDSRRLAFGLVSQAAQHAKATGTIPAEATNAALLCESALSWDAGDAPAHARQSYPAVWRGRLDACV